MGGEEGVGPIGSSAAVSRAGGECHLVVVVVVVVNLDLSDLINRKSVLVQWRT